ncbi:MAG: homocysteine S-methyltransferase family protein [Anaerolineaceae bacterium]
MSKNKFMDLLESKKYLVSDGATGSNLQQRGLDKGKAAETWVIENPKAIQQLHLDFLNAGSDILLTCTFGANRLRLEHAGLGEKVNEVNTRAVQIAREAIADRTALVAGSMGPLGQMLKPLGLLDVEDAWKIYAEQAQALSAAGVDVLVVETQFDINEATAAIQGTQSVCDIPVVCSFSYDRGVKTMMGTSPTKMAQALAQFDLAALGINCGKSLPDNLACLKELKQVTGSPIWFKPNAGLPAVDDLGNAVYTTTPADMGNEVVNWIAEGAAIMGGCCGTSPEHLAAIAQEVNKFKS